MQRVAQKFRKPKYKFWLGLGLAAGLLLLEVIPRSAAHAHAPQLPSEAQIRADIVKGAQSFLNLPYHFGGASPSGFDCSGLVLYLYKKHGFAVPHRVIEMRPTLRITKTPQPGDVIFFRNPKGIVGHVGIYVDTEKFIHAPVEGAVIRYEKLKSPYWARNYVEVRSVF